MGQLGGHSYNHAKALAESDVLSKILRIYKEERSSDDLRKKCKESLKSILVMCSVLDALEPLIEDAPEEILVHILN